MDWSAAVWAGLVAGLLSLLLNSLLSWFAPGDPWLPVRLIASVVMGPEVLQDTSSNRLLLLLVALPVHLALSIGFACLVALVFHRWGLLVGILGGALFGLALYFINFYTLSFLVPWFYPMGGWILALSHVLYGALAGGVYEALEEDEEEGES
jgi:hypothetical protein